MDKLGEFTDQEISSMRERIRSLESYTVFVNMLLESIGNVIEGEQVSDFELSFPIVRQVQDLYDLKKED